ncbi:PEP-CTERM sorting domain-containing protein [Rubripirellula tenax]|nr:PEP-CTERM sorting domain-containing protein [Rubripirellula tenax]
MSALVTYVEVNESLSTESANPTDLGAFDVGLNRVEGGFPANGNDVFRFQIVPGQSLTGILLVDYSSHFNRMFFAIENDTTFPVSEDTLLFDGNSLSGDEFLGGLLVGTAAQIGTNLLPRIGNNNLFIGRGFAADGLPAEGPLGPGDYTVYLQQTGPATTYKLDFQVSAVAVPEPSSFAMFGLAACGLIFQRRRQKRTSKKRQF